MSLFFLWCTVPLIITIFIIIFIVFWFKYKFLRTKLRKILFSFFYQKILWCVLFTIIFSIFYVTKTLLEQLKTHNNHLYKLYNILFCSYPLKSLKIYLLLFSCLIIFKKTHKLQLKKLKKIKKSYESVVSLKKYPQFITKNYHIYVLYIK